MKRRLRMESLEDRTTPTTFTVMNTNDSGAGSFRQAIIDANTAGTADTVDFDTSGVFATPQTIVLSSALPQFPGGGGTLTITGPGEMNLTIKRDAAAANFGIFNSVTPTLTMTGITVSGGNAGSGFGGGLRASGTVTLDHVVFSGNAAGEGGAIFMNATAFLNLKNSTVSGNTSGNRAGGVFAYYGSLLIENSTIIGNSAGGVAGGFYFSGPASASPPSGFTANTLVVRNSTISNNSAGTAGGGIKLTNFTGSLFVQNSTLSGNSAATNGGAISQAYGSLTVQNSTLVGNSAVTPGGAIGTAFGGAIAVTNGSGSIAIQDSTIFGNSANGTIAGTGGGGLARTSTSGGTITVTNSVIAGDTNTNSPDLLTGASSTVNVNFSAIGSNAGFTASGTSANNIAPGADLKLVPLAFEGGPTRTLAPAFGSPLIDAGQGVLIPSGVTTDQRGGSFARTSGAVDIGAVESQAPFIPVASANTTLVNTAGNTSYQFTVTYSDPQGAAGAINTASIINNNNAIRVTGPGGFSVLATYVTIDNAANGTPRTATYSITPPGGAWDPLDFGTYTVSIQASQVADSDGNFVVADAIGSFNVLSPYIVTNADDSGAGSLRDAIAQADATSSPDAIVFSPSFFNVPRTITLLTTLPTLPANGGALTINGTGEANLTIQRDAGAATNFRVLSSLAPALTLTGLTVSGGNMSGNGGGIEATGILTLDHVTLSGNRATGVGGGIHMNPGFLMVRNSTITGNIATGSSGGGVRVYQGSWVVENSTITNNSSAGGNGGGGLYFGGTASATPPIGFTANTLVVRNSSVTGNSTTTGSNLGGGGIGVINLTGALLVQNSIVSGNSASTNGGGIAVRYGTVNVQNSTISGNTAGTLGGGISIYGSNTAVNLQNSTIAGNTAGVLSGAILTASGGGIAINSGNGPITIQNSTIVGNMAFGNAAGTGGGGLARTTTTAGTITIANSVIAGNSNANAPDLLTAATGSTVNVNFSAIGSNAGFALSGTSANNIAPGANLKLLPLAFVGGSMRTIAPAFGSPLIDGGQNPLVPASLTTDQRGAGFARIVGSAVDIGAVENQAPFLPVAVANASPVTTAGDTTYQFTVTYSDPQGATGAINTAGIINNNNAIRVTGPGGFNVLATYVSIDNAANGTPRTATYSFTPPGGAWDPLDSGIYTVSIQANQVADMDGNFIAADTIGSFAANSPFIVTNADDAGAGSLRDAITSANTTASPDTILFSPTFFNVPRTITLLTALPTLPANGGTMTITGTGEANLTIQRDGAAGNFRVFSSLAPALTLTGMTISGGNVGGNGGGIDATGVLTLDHVVLSGNRATGAGGGINMNPGFLLMRNSTVTGNISAGSSGGGVRVYTGSWEVENSTISNNSSAGANGGGGLYFGGTASANPPIGFSPSTLVVRNSTVSGNTTTTGSSLGGGGISVINFTGTLLVQNSAVSGNSAATNGGGISLHYGTLSVQNSTIAGNTTGTSGGGIAVLGSNGTLNLQNSTIVGNTAGTLSGAISSSSGGGIAVTAGTAATTIQNSTIFGNTALGTAAGSGGGGIARTTTSTGTMTIANSVVAGNSNANGPDILTAATGSTVNVNFSAIGSNTGYTPSGISANNLAPGTNLKLLPLAFVGGTLRTMVPALGSPLIDAGQNPLVPASLTTDQRGAGFVRIAGSAVDIGAVESQAPFIPVANANTSFVNTAGNTSYQFTVTYSDPQGAAGAINTAGIINNNNAIRVTGPGGFNVLATYVSIDNAANGTPRTATYSITPPGGAWDPLDFGTYTISIQANQVADIDGNFIVADSIGSISVLSPYVVTNADDSGAGSLRDAIIQANATTSPDVIEFSPAFFNVPRTITLLTALPQFPAAGGALTITGTGEANLTVKRSAAAGSFGVFNSLAPTLTMTGMTVSGGSGVAGAGLQLSGTVTLDHMTFSGNSGTSGGAIFSNTSGGFIRLSNSTLTGNTATSSGGGLYLYSGGLVIDNCTISTNSAAAGSGGGGLLLRGTPSASPPAGFTPSTFVVRNSTVSDNTASAAAGGGISMPFLGGTLLVQNSTFSGNTTSTTGGGISSAYATVILQNTTMSANTATTSGGGFAVTGGTGATTIQNSTIVGNTANGSTAGGGGIARTTTSVSTITIANSVIAGNTNANGPDVLTAATGSTVNVNFSAIGNNTGYTQTAISANNIAPGTNLLLGTLANNGGPTKTMAPQPGSPLINAGADGLVPAGLTTDQRGGTLDRKFGIVDIGSFEVQTIKVSIDQAAGQPDPTNGSSIDFAVKFNAPVTGFDASDIIFPGSTTGGTLVPVISGSGTDYTVTVTGMAADGNVVASILANAAVDGSQSSNAASTSTDNTVRVDKTTPMVTINQAGTQADPTNGSPVTFAVHFNEIVTGFTGADISFAGSTVGGTLVANVTGTGADYVVTVSGMTGDGNVVASIPAASALDLATNGNSASTSTDNVVHFDNVSPDVTINRSGSQADPTKVASIVFDVHFTESVTGLTNSDISFAGSTVGGTLAANVTGSGTDYTVTVTGMTGEGDVVASIPAASANDAAGNGNTASTSTDNSVHFDAIAPSVTINQGASQFDPTHGSSIAFDVHFSENVTGFGDLPADVSFAGSTVGGTLVANVTGSGADYVVTVTGMTGVGTVVASISAGAAVDLAGNNSVASISTDNSVLFDNFGDLQFSAPVFNTIENSPTVTITVTRTNGSANAVSVQYDTSDGTATAGATQDYDAASGTLSWANGETGAKTFTITLHDDFVIESTETINLALSNPTGGATLGAQSTAVVQIADFEGAVFDFSSPTFTVSEEGGFATISVARTVDFSSAVSIDYATSDGTAHSGGSAATGQNDYTPTTGTLSWAAGETGTKSFTVPILDDVLNEGNETIGLALSNPTGGSRLGTQTTAELAILPSDHKHSPTFFDSDNDKVTIKFAGTGELAYFLTDPDGDGKGPIELIELTDTQPDPLKPVSSVTITVAKAAGNVGPDAGRVGLGAVTGSGLKSFSGKTVDLNGDGINLNGYLGALTVGNVTNGADIITLGTTNAAQSTKITAGIIDDNTTIDVGAALNSLTAMRIGVGSILAPSIGTLTVKGNPKAGIAGDLASDITISGVGVAAGKPALKTLKVAGAVTNSDIFVNGNVTTFSVGAFRDSRLFAGYSGPDDGSGAFNLPASVTTFTVTGKTDGFQNSRVIATSFKTVTLTSLDSTNGNNEFGFYADTAVGSLKVVGPTAFKYDPKNPAPQGPDDFKVRIV
ncbi:MAG TPA: choice-of-anchor Q domain-containing protein [Gemmataceae bacterium]|jgi:parallel beta-helix repeat protein|nr:choice-of-anchor Q domain-containing protein [Gemmataceae bacterium]